MHSAGLSLSWFRNSFHPETSYNELESMAQRVQVGSNHLIFMPFLLGERQSTQSSVPASFMGIRPQHNPGHFVRAIYEGVAFEFRRMIENWHRTGMMVEEVRFSGGGSKSNLWAGHLGKSAGLTRKKGRPGVHLLGPASLLESVQAGGNP